MYSDVDTCVPAVCIILLLVVSVQDRNTPCVLLLGHAVLLFKDYTMCIATGPCCIVIQAIHHVYCYWAMLYCYSRNTPCVLLLGHAVLLFKDYTMCIATGPCCIAIQGIHHVYCYWAMLYCYSSNTPCVLLLGHAVLLFKEYTMCIATGPCCIAEYTMCIATGPCCIAEYTMCIATGPCCIVIQAIHHVYCYWAMLYCYSRTTPCVLLLDHAVLLFQIYVLAGVNSE